MAVARRLGPAGRRVGIDIAEPMITAARARAEREGSSASFVRADAQDHTFERSAPRSTPTCRARKSASPQPAGWSAPEHRPRRRGRRARSVPERRVIASQRGWPLTGAVLAPRGRDGRGRLSAAVRVRHGPETVVHRVGYRAQPAHARPRKLSEIRQPFPVRGRLTDPVVRGAAHHQAREHHDGAARRRRNEDLERRPPTRPGRRPHEGTR
ncbi:methyltransferase domain-containing protein [Streptomyces sp. 2A115]|uniref:methyltransferase domain-containing protein n=1 Tax=Streptomyces sp. 2A115 TaxID=3457439 RepID=UPI003FD62722